MKRVSLKGIIIPLLLVIVGAGIAVGAYVTTSGGSTFELRKKAADTKGSQLVFTAPKQVEVGKPFTVELVLDTAGDLDYTISGVDAVVSYGPQGQALTLLSVIPGKIFDSYPAQVPLPPAPSPTCVPLPPCAVEGERTRDGSIVMCSLSDIPPGGGEWCPRTQAQKTCGGFAGERCPQGYECIYTDPPTQSDRQGICQIAGQAKFLNPVIISGVKNYSVNDKGYFNGFTGQGVFATLTFVAQRSGKATIILVYKGPSATDDANVNGFLANQPVSLQKPQERLLTAPQAFTVEVVASQPTTPTPGTCPTPPACKVPLIVGDPAPGSKDQCPKYFCPEPTPTPTPPFPCQPRPSCLDVPPYCKLEVPPGRWCPTTPTPKPSCTPLPPCAYEGVPDPNDPSRRVFCAIDLLPGAWSCPRPTVTPTPTPKPTPTPTPTPVPSARLNIYVESDGKAVHRQVRVYGQRDYVTLLGQVQGVQAYAAGFGDLSSSTQTVQVQGTQPQSPPSPVIVSGPPGSILPSPVPTQYDSLILLGSAVTDSAGNATVEIPSQYHNIPWRLFVQTPSHLIRLVQSVKLGETPGIPGSVVGSNVIVFKPNTVARAMFTNLIPGDLYIAEGKTRQDGVINNFDIAELFRAWGPYPRPVPPQTGNVIEPTPVAADFNDDGVVNNRDFAIILTNFGKEGDVTAFRETLVPLPATGSRPQP